MLGELPYFEAFTSAKDDMGSILKPKFFFKSLHIQETSLKNKKSYEPENQPLNEYRALSTYL